MKYGIIAQIDLKNVIEETREVSRALYKFADELEQIEKKYAEPQKSKRNE